jgi:hypothetical protein
MTAHIQIDNDIEVVTANFYWFRLTQKLQKKIFKELWLPRYIELTEVL